MVELNNLVIVSDLHCGCQLALCPPKIKLDEGGFYEQSPLQQKLWNFWKIFWKEAVPEFTRKEPYGVLINGDAIEGSHHHSVTQISQNPSDQQKIAEAVLKPIVDGAKMGTWMIRGTEAHVAASASDEERLAKALGAVQSPEGNYTHYEVWKMVGDRLLHALHHLGTTGSQAYEATALHKELVEMFVDAARWRRRPPDVMVRSHRHRHIETTLATGDDSDNTGRAIAVCTPSWQGKTPFSWKVAGGRLSTPQFGGIVVRVAKGEIFVRSKVWTVDRGPIQ